MEFVDIHTHVLPNIDDGAADLDETFEMLVEAHKQGTRIIVATPHCNIPEVYGNYLGKRYKEIFMSTRKLIQKEKLPIVLLPGMEVFATPDLPDLLKNNRIMTINKSRYILLEFGFEEDVDFVTYILNQVSSMGYVPIIAHVERYKFVQLSPWIVNEWISEKYLVQGNTGSFLGLFGKNVKDTAFKLLEHQLYTVLASDAHDAVTRTMNMKVAYELMKQKTSKKYLSYLFERNPENICLNKFIVRRKPIPFEENGR